MPFPGLIALLASSIALVFFLIVCSARASWRRAYEQSLREFEKLLRR